MTGDEVERIRERANSVLDGFTTHRMRIAEDAKSLADEVLRLNRIILSIKLQMAAGKSTFSEQFWKDSLLKEWFK